MSEKDSKRNWLKSYALFSLVVADLIAYTGIGVGIGYWAYKSWNAPWWVPLLTSLAGLISAFYRLLKLLEKADESEKDEVSEEFNGDQK
jgi:F0F1-type ATP synthase assembly protein I